MQQNTMPKVHYNSDDTDQPTDQQRAESSSVTINRLDTQISDVLYNPKVHYSIHNSPRLVLTKKTADDVVLQMWFLNVYAVSEASGHVTVPS
jgi:hypothetical protein